MMSSAAIAASAQASASYAFPTTASEMPTQRAIQDALNRGESVTLPSGTLNLATPLVVPQGANLKISGAAPGATTVNVPNASVAILYERGEAAGPTHLVLEDLAFVGADMSASAVIFHGRDGTDDASVRIENCNFSGLFNCVWLRNAGACHFDRITARMNAVCWILERATNVIRFDGVLCVSNRRFIHLDDPAADGMTHGLSLTNSHSIFSSEEDIYLVGGQTIYIDGCSLDLGIGGKCALYLDKCQDVRFSNGWIAAGIEGRDGANIVDSTRFSVSTSTINNNARGLVVRGPVPYPTGGTITGNQFGANRRADLVLEGDVTGLVTDANQFMSLDETFPDITDRQELIITGEGNRSNIFTNNVFSGPEFDIASAEENIVGPNIWDAKGFLVRLVFEQYDMSFIPEDARLNLNDALVLEEKLSSIHAKARK